MTDHAVIQARVKTDISKYIFFKVTRISENYFHRLFPAIQYFMLVLENQLLSKLHKLLSVWKYLKASLTSKLAFIRSGVTLFGITETFRST